MGAGLTGRESAIAFVKASSWGTAVAVTKGVYFQSTGGLKLESQRVNDEAFGQAFYGTGDLGDVTAPDLEWVGRSRYDDHTFILDALAMGSPAAAVISDSTSGQTASYLHVIDLAVDTDGLVACAAIDKEQYVDELTSFKVYGLMEANGDAGVMDKTYKVMGSKPTDISSTNTRSTVHGASFTSLSNRVFRKQGTFRLNAQGATGLVAGDAVTVEEWSLEFERPQDAPFVFGQDYVYEPANNGFPTVKLTFRYPRFGTLAASMRASRRNNAVWKGDMTFLGANINSTDQYQRLYEFPYLEVDDLDENLEGANQLKAQVTMTAKLAASAPTSMPGVTKPFRLTLINTHDTEAF